MEIIINSNKELAGLANNCPTQRDLHTAAIDKAVAALEKEGHGVTCAPIYSDWQGGKYDTTLNRCTYHQTATFSVAVGRDWDAASGAARERVYVILGDLHTSIHYITRPEPATLIIRSGATEPTAEAIKARADAQNYETLVSQVLEINGGRYQVVLDGMDSLRAATLDGRDPDLVVAAPVGCDSANLLEIGNPLEYLASLHDGKWAYVYGPPIW